MEQKQKTKQIEVRNKKVEKVLPIVVVVVVVVAAVVVAVVVVVDDALDEVSRDLAPNLDLDSE